MPILPDRSPTRSDQWRQRKVFFVLLIGLSATAVLAVAPSRSSDPPSDSDASAETGTTTSSRSLDRDARSTLPAVLLTQIDTVKIPVLLPAANGDVAVDAFAPIYDGYAASFSIAGCQFSVDGHPAPSSRPINDATPGMLVNGAPAVFNVVEGLATLQWKEGAAVYGLETGCIHPANPHDQVVPVAESLFNVGGSVD